MKNLNNYIQEKQTACLKKHNVFFAFSNEQFNQQQIKGCSYVALGIGMYCPKDNVKAFNKEHSDIVNTGIQQDLLENGKTAIIKRELNNYECYYTGDIEDAIEALKCYNITTEEIINVFNTGSIE